MTVRPWFAWALALTLFFVLGSLGCGLPGVWRAGVGLLQAWFRCDAVTIVGVAALLCVVVRTILAKEPGPRDPEGQIFRFWWKMSEALRAHAQLRSMCCLVGLRNREGLFLLVAAVVLCVLIAIAHGLADSISQSAATVLFVAGLYYLVDAALVNTSIVFVTHQPIDRLRSVLLTLLNVVNLALVFALFYVLVGPCFPASGGNCKRLTGLEAVYFSLTVTTVGSDGLLPTCQLGKLALLGEVFTGVYFLAVIIAVVTSWRPEPRSR